MNEKQFNSD